MNQNKKKKEYAITRYINGLFIYFKEYCLFLKNGTFTVFKIIRYGAYSYGFQIIVILSCITSYASILQTQAEVAPLLVKEGTIE